MGPGGIVDAARAATAGNALHAWGSAVAGALDDAGVAMRGMQPPSFADGLAALRPVHRDLVHTTGWELRHAFVWRNDERCIQRAALGALSLAEREAGSLTDAVGRLARDDAMSAAMTITYSPTFGNARLHSAVIARTLDDELLVIDHLVADADDGVLPLAEWMRRIGARDETTTVLSPLRQPPMSLTNAGPGIPVSAQPRSGEDWQAFAHHLATSWDESATRNLPVFQKI